MKRLSQFFLAVLLLTVVSTGWAACNHLICGSWQITNTRGQTWTGQVGQGFDPQYPFVLTISNLGSLRGTGVRVGDPLMRFGCLGSTQCIGQELWVGNSGPMGWRTMFIQMTSQNAFKSDSGTKENTNTTQAKRGGSQPTSIDSSRGMKNYWAIKNGEKSLDQLNSWELGEVLEIYERLRPSGGGRSCTGPYCGYESAWDYLPGSGQWRCRDTGGYRGGEFVRNSECASQRKIDNWP